MAVLPGWMLVPTRAAPLRQTALPACLPSGVYTATCVPSSTLLVYPAERSRCRFRVFVARLGGIDTDVIGHTQLHLISASSLDVRIGYGVLADGAICSTTKRQFSILIADGRLLALLRSWCSTTARSFFNKHEVFPTISCLILIYR